MNDEHEDSSKMLSIGLQYDPRIAEALDQINCQYEIDQDNGDFSIGVILNNNRTHDVLIQSKTELFMGVEMRKIFAPALYISGPFDANTSNLLLRENSKILFGNWLVDVSDGLHFAVFSVTVAASLGAKALGDMIDLVACVADSMEERLTGMDSI